MANEKQLQLALRNLVKIGFDEVTAKQLLYESLAVTMKINLVTWVRVGKRWKKG